MLNNTIASHIAVDHLHLLLIYTASGMGGLVGKVSRWVVPRCTKGLDGWAQGAMVSGTVVARPDDLAACLDLVPPLGGGWPRGLTGTHYNVKFHSSQ